MLAKKKTTWFPAPKPKSHKKKTGALIGLGVGLFFGVKSVLFDHTKWSHK